MVTLICQSPNEFELHLRAILGLPIPAIELARPVGLGGDPRRPRKRRLSRSKASPRRSAARRAGTPGRPAHLRQAQHAQEPPDGRGAGPRRNGRGCGRAAVAAPRRVQNPLCGRASLKEKPCETSNRRHPDRCRCCRPATRRRRGEPRPTRPRSRSAAPSRTGFTSSTRSTSRSRSSMRFTTPVFTCQRGHRRRLCRRISESRHVDGALRRRARLGDLRRA